VLDDVFKENYPRFVFEFAVENIELFQPSLWACFE